MAANDEARPAADAGSRRLGVGLGWAPVAGRTRYITPMTSPSDWSAIEVRANGIDFSVHVDGDEASDTLALCLHGFPENWYSWRHQMPLLSRLGYRVWAPDLRGYGGSDKPRELRAYAMDVLVEDVAGLIDASGKKKVILLAHDWGGNVAWEFMARKLRPVERFVVMNMPHPRVFRRHLRLLDPQLRRSWYVLLFQLPGVPEWWLARDGHRAIGAAFASMAVDRSRFPPDVLEHYRREAARPGALEGMLAYYRAGMRFPSRVRHSGRVDAPTLVVWGENDTALGAELAKESVAFLSEGTLRWIPSCSHWVQQEAPEKVNAILEPWLRGEEPPVFG